MNSLKRYLVIGIGVLFSSNSFCQMNNPCSFSPYPSWAEVTINGACLPVTTSGMTNIFNPTGCLSGSSEPDGWVWFQGDGSNVDIEYQNNQNWPSIHVYEVTSPPCSGLLFQGCDASTGADLLVNINTTLGAFYLIMIQEVEGNLGWVTNGCVSVTSTGPPPVLGCTDPAATNYNPSATVNDGSCLYPAPDYTHPTVGIENEFVGACLVSDCGPFSYTDDGGFSGNYALNTNGIYRVFCPDQAGNCMRVTFNSFSTEGPVTLSGQLYATDLLQIKNGPTQNSPEFTTAPATSYPNLINWAGGPYVGVSGNPATPFSFTSTDASGCLTFRFFESGIIPGAGWDATLECVPCAGGPSGTENNDCINLTPLCSGATVPGDASGPGIVAEGCTGSTCPAGGENHTNWYLIKAQTAGTIEITIEPTDPSDDYDFAVYGPNVTCNNLGSPLRCTDSGLFGTTGTNSTAGDNTEDVYGDSFLQTINANVGDEFIIVVDEWSPNVSATGYEMSFGGTASLDCDVLPVELADFTVEYVPDQDIVDLSWITESERDNDRFEVEKSTDGVNWEIIHTVKGQGTTQHQTQYYVADPTPHIGVNYYRLNQWDTDGNGKYSEIKSINILDNFYDMLSLFPNPTNGKTEVIYNSYTTEPSLLTVTDADGKVVVNTPVDTKKGGNRFELDMSGQSRGVYVVTITTRDKVYRTKLVKE